MARVIDADAVLDRYYAEFEKQDIFDMSQDRDWLMRCIVEAPTLTPQNEPMTWEELMAETKINPVYSIKYGWIFPSTVKDEPYKQVWFFTSKGFANTELFHRDTFYRRPPERQEDTDA